MPSSENSRTLCSKGNGGDHKKNPKASPVKAAQKAALRQDKTKEEVDKEKEGINKDGSLTKATGKATREVTTATKDAGKAEIGEDGTQNAQQGC